MYIIFLKKNTLKYVHLKMVLRKLIRKIREWLDKYA